MGQMSLRQGEAIEVVREGPAGGWRVSGLSLQNYIWSLGAETQSFSQNTQSPATPLNVGASVVMFARPKFNYSARTARADVSSTG
jgi:hypothetical protein